MRVAISQSNFIPWKGYFDSIAAVDLFILYDDVQYTRRDWRNRSRIKTAQGLKWLTIPVQVKGKRHQKINETRVSDTKWAETHWRTITHHYGKAPGFAEWADRLDSLYAEATSPMLSEINAMFLRRICGWLNVRTPLRGSHEFTLVEGKTERLVDLCQQVGATAYYSGPAARDYIDERLFADAGIEIHYWDYGGYPKYPQLHGEFEHGVSIVDLLLCTGEDWAAYMKCGMKGW